MNPIEFKPRWREELEAISAEGKLIFEFTMGREYVYFPDQNRWLEQAPEWARDKWAGYLKACETWCTQHRIPISVVPDAHMSFEPLM